MAEKSVTIREGAFLLLQQLADRPMKEWPLLVELALLAAKSCGVEETLVMAQLAQSGHIGHFTLDSVVPGVMELRNSYERDISRLGNDLQYMRDYHAG